MINEAVDQLSQVVSKGAALSALGVDRATWYRKHRCSALAVKPERNVSTFFRQLLHEFTDSDVTP